MHAGVYSYLVNRLDYNLHIKLNLLDFCIKIAWLSVTMTIVKSTFFKW